MAKRRLSLTDRARRELLALPELLLYPMTTLIEHLRKNPEPADWSEPISKLFPVWRYIRIGFSIR